jgi:hypothetical protein
MEGSVLSFLKAEWKVSDTGSAHWASSLCLLLIVSLHKHPHHDILLPVYSSYKPENGQIVNSFFLFWAIGYVIMWSS